MQIKYSPRRDADHRPCSLRVYLLNPQSRWLTKYWTPSTPPAPSSQLYSGTANHAIIQLSFHEALDDDTSTTAVLLNDGHDVTTDHLLLQLRGMAHV